MLVLYPGNSQTDSIFMDSTLWWQVADKEGIVLAFVCETYSASPSSVSHADSDKFYNSLMAVLEETIDGTYAIWTSPGSTAPGQSAGSMATQALSALTPNSMRLLPPPLDWPCLMVLLSCPRGLAGLCPTLSSLARATWIT